MAKTGLFWAIVAALVLAAVSFAAGRNRGVCEARRGISNDTIVRVDTITVTEVRIDTVERVRTVTAYLPLADTIYRDRIVRDTVAVEVPLSRYVAQEDSLYRVVATGYAVDFKEITVYPKTVTICNTLEVVKPTRWGIGIQAGYGATLHNNTVNLAPYIGVGISYNILTW